MPDSLKPRPEVVLAPIVEDHCYLRHGERRMMARIFTPAGEEGPFPCLIDLHGGRWHGGDLEDRDSVGRYLGARGFVVVTLNFRQGADAYPSSLADINYGIRWIKAHAARLKVDPDRIAIGGPSTGGHLAMLAAMRPRDPRYAAIPLPAGLPPVDARVCAVVMQWPMINPLSRYRAANPASKWLQASLQYWQNEANAAEGNPMLMLERGEKVALPKTIWIQQQPDLLHDYRDPETDFPGNEPERFASYYRKAGGDIEVMHFDRERVGFATFLYLTRDFLRGALAPV
jgi:acetyl esterase/lipase